MELVENYLVPQGTGKAFLVEIGHIVRFSLPEGPQVVDMDAFNADNLKEFLGSSVTRREEGIHVTTGNYIWTCAPWERHMFLIVSDTVKHEPSPSGARSHDFLMGRCSRNRRIRSYGVDSPGCQEILTGAMEAIGKTSDYVHDPFNIFMKTGVNSDGRSFWEASDAVKGDYIDLKAEMKCIVSISACPGMSSGRVGHPVGIEIYSPEGA